MAQPPGPNGIWTFSAKTKSESGVVDYYKNGVRQPDDVGTTDDSSGTTVYTGSGPFNGAGSFRSLSITGNSSAHIYYQRQLVVTCTWGRDPNDHYGYALDPVPSKLSFTYYPDAVARFGSGSRLQADDGYGDAPTGDGLSVSRSTAKRLYSRDSNGQKVITVTLPMGRADAWLQSSATNTNTSAGAEAYVIVGGFVSDNRSVRIIRNGAPSPKLDGDSTLNKDHDEWVEADGTGHGHTRYSYYESDAAGGNPVLRPNTQSFAANRFGNWGANLSWLWEPRGNPSAASGLDSNTVEMTTGSLYKNIFGDWKGSPTSPTTQLYTYTLREDGGDGAKATAKYSLTLHDEFERNYPEVVLQRNTNVRVAPGAQWVTSTSDDSDLVVYAEKSYGWSVDVSFAGPEAGFVASQLGLTLGGSVNFSVTTGASAPLRHVDKDYATYLELYDAIKIHNGYLDKWTELGYYGVVSYQVIEPDNPAGGIQAHSPPVYRGNGTP